MLPPGPSHRIVLSYSAPVPGDVVSEMPTWDGFLVFVLRALEDGQTIAVRDVYERVADIVGLTPEQRLETIESGQARYKNRIGWAISSLARADGVARPKRATYTITDIGRDLLKQHPDGFGEWALRQIPAYQNYVPASKAGSGGQPDVSRLTRAEDSGLDPVEQISAGVSRIHQDVAAQLLTRLQSGDPEFLEQTVLDLLVAMGYGGVEQRARRIGGSGDGGVDGVIDQDALGLARIYVQAKRYKSDNVVGRPQVQGFVGALHGQQADQGVFISTSSFTREASDYARQVNASVVLIDGARLASLMIQYRVGVQVENTYTVVKLDEDFFETA
jgi:restriction system protein